MSSFDKRSESGTTLAVCPQARAGSPATNREGGDLSTGGGRCWQVRAPSCTVPAVGEGARVPGATAAPGVPVRRLRCPLHLPLNRQARSSAWRPQAAVPVPAPLTRPGPLPPLPHRVSYPESWGAPYSLAGTLQPVFPRSPHHRGPRSPQALTLAPSKSPTSSPAYEHHPGEGGVRLHVWEPVNPEFGEVTSHMHPRPALRVSWGRVSSAGGPQAAQAPHGHGAPPAKRHLLRA